MLQYDENDLAPAQTLLPEEIGVGAGVSCDIFEGQVSGVSLL